MKIKQRGNNQLTTGDYFLSKKDSMHVKHSTALHVHKAIPIKCFVSHCPTDPFFSKCKIKTKNSDSLVRGKYFNLQAHDLVLLTTIGMM